MPNVNELYARQMGKDLRAWAGFNYQNWQAAAQFAAANKVNLEEALVWADKAISEPFRNAAQGRADFSTLQTKAAVLTAMGRDADADTVIDRATFEKPNVPSAGVPYVLVQGVVVVDGGNVVEGVHPGKGIKATNRPTR